MKGKKKKRINTKNDTALNLSNKEGNPSEKTQKIIPETENKFVTLIENLNKYSNLIVGVATVLLVIVTAIYISLSWKIATETKRLADVTVEQFKIKSFPSFLILRSNPTFIEGRFKDEIEIHNKGEITSFETSFLMLLCVAQKDVQPNKLFYYYDELYIYRDKDLEDMDIFDYSKKILANSGTMIGIDKNMPTEIIDNLKYNIIIIRHKVPYDTHYRYEIHIYALESKKQNVGKYNLHWETIPESTKNMLVENLFESQIIAPNREDKIQHFFEDYRNGKKLNFYKKNTK